MTTGRTGSDYLNACLDDVDGLMTFCGYFTYHEFFKDKKEKINKAIILDAFLKKYTHLFSFNERENIDTGVDVDKLKRTFLKISPSEFLDRKEFLINIYKSYHMTLDRKINDKTILIHHSHGMWQTKKVLEDFPESKILITIRDPRANLKSGLVNWFRYDADRIHMDHIFIYLKRIREDLNYVLKLDNKKLFVKLEEANNLKTKEKICEFLKINYDQKIMTATLASKFWNGDRLSEKQAINGQFNESVKKNGWEGYFLKREKTLLSLVYKKYEIFGYNLEKITLYQRFCFIFLIIFPFSFEKDTFKQKSFNVKQKVSNYFFFLKRIIYLTLVLFNLNFLIKHRGYE